jgi:hypothetical protein
VVNEAGGRESERRTRAISRSPDLFRKRRPGGPREAAHGESTQHSWASLRARVVHSRREAAHLALLLLCVQRGEQVRAHRNGHRARVGSRVTAGGESLADGRTIARRALRTPRLRADAGRAKGRR